MKSLLLPSPYYAIRTVEVRHHRANDNITEDKGLLTIKIKNTLKMAKKWKPLPAPVILSAFPNQAIALPYRKMVAMQC
jgi:hypothetical protein